MISLGYVTGGVGGGRKLRVGTGARQAMLLLRAHFSCAMAASLLMVQKL